MSNNLMPGSWAGYGYQQPNTGGGLMEYFNADNLSDTLGGVGNIASGLYSMYAGNKMLDMHEENLGLAKDQWKESKQELNHMRGTRKRLTSAYTR